MTIKNTKTAYEIPYPESIGTKIGKEVREKCNKLTTAERKTLFDKGIKIIYTGSGLDLP